MKVLIVVDETVTRRLAVRGVELRVREDVLPFPVDVVEFRAPTPLVEIFATRRADAKPEKNRGPTPRRKHRR